MISINLRPTNVYGSYDSKINVRVDFETQFIAFSKILIAQRIEHDFKKSCLSLFKFG